MNKLELETIRESTELVLLLLCLLVLVIIGLVGWDAYLWARTLKH